MPEDPDQGFDAAAFADAYGFRRVETAADGTLIVTMAKTMFNQMRDEIADGKSLKMDAIVGSKRTPFILSIEKGKDFRTITIDVDAEGYLAYDGPLAYEVGVLARIYQTAAGIEAASEVTIRDVQTKMPIPNIR